AFFRGNPEGPQPAAEGSCPAVGNEVGSRGVLRGTLAAAARADGCPRRSSLAEADAGGFGVAGPDQHGTGGPGPDPEQSADARRVVTAGGHEGAGRPRLAPEQDRQPRPGGAPGRWPPPLPRGPLPPPPGEGAGGRPGGGLAGPRPSSGGTAGVPAVREAHGRPGLGLCEQGGWRRRITLTKMLLQTDRP